MPGVWWDSSSSSKLSIRERINKAQSAFFSHGQLGAFQGLLNPLSSCSIVECCVLPVLMYGSESWVLNSTLLSSLESFQSELGKRILKLPKHTSNSIPLLVLNWPSMGGRILCNKLSFLIRSSQDQCDSLKSQVFNSLAASDVMSMSIVKQCKFLDEKLGSDFTNEALSQPQTSQRKLKEHIIQFDRKRILMLSEGHPSLEFVLEAARRNIWIKFWDTALDHGEPGTKTSLSILKLLCMTVFNDRKCPSEGCDFIVPEATPLCTHFIKKHTNLPPETTPLSYRLYHLLL